MLVIEMAQRFKLSSPLFLHFSFYQPLSPKKAFTAAMSNYKPTVMPKDESLHRQTQDAQLGAPGIQLPQDAKTISEFSEIRNVDAKQLNAKLHGNVDKSSDETKAKIAASGPGIQLVETPENVKEFGEIRNVNAKDLN